MVKKIKKIKKILDDNGFQYHHRDNADGFVNTRINQKKV